MDARPVRHPSNRMLSENAVTVLPVKQVSIVEGFVQSKPALQSLPPAAAMSWQITSLAASMSGGMVRSNSYLYAVILANATELTSFP